MYGIRDAINGGNALTWKALGVKGGKKLHLNDLKEEKMDTEVFMEVLVQQWEVSA